MVPQKQAFAKENSAILLLSKYKIILDFKAKVVTVQTSGFQRFLLMALNTVTLKKRGLL